MCVCVCWGMRGGLEFFFLSFHKKLVINPHNAKIVCVRCYVYLLSCMIKHIQLLQLIPHCETLFLITRYEKLDCLFGFLTHNLLYSPLTHMFLRAKPKFWIWISISLFSIFFFWAIGIESFSKLGDSIYFEEEGKIPALYIIQYISSSLNWRSGNISLNQQVEQVVSWDPRLQVAFTFSSKEVCLTM